MKRIIGIVVAMSLVALLAAPSIALAFIDLDGDGICDTGGGDGIPDYDGDGLKYRGGR